MSAGVSTLNNYTKRVLMVGPRCNLDLNPCSFNFAGLLPPLPHYAAPCPPPSPPRISHLSPYFRPPASEQRLVHSHSFPPAPCRPAAASPPFPYPPLAGEEQELRYHPEEAYSPL